MTAMTLRLPDEVHEYLRVRAFNERTTITALILAALEERPKAGWMCDVRRCLKTHTRITSGGFHFCDEHAQTDHG